MASGKDEIRHRVSLEGADDVARRLKGIGDVGSDAFKKVKQAADDTSFGKFGSAAADSEGKIEAHRLATERFRETLHILHPVLDEAGLGIGNLGAFARVASGGMLGLAAAIVGSVVVGLAKLADQAATTKKQLDDLSPGQGASHFAGLQEDARRLKTDVDNLVPAFKQALGLRNDLNAGNRNEIYAPGKEPFNLPGGPLSNENLHTATGAVQSLFAAGKASDPGKAAEDFFTAVRKAGGRLTPEALQGAAAASPGAANKIAQSLPEGFATFQQAIAALQGGKVIDKDELFRSLTKAAPDAEKAAQSVRGFTEGIDAATSALKDLAKSATPDNFGGKLGKGLDNVAGDIRGAADFIEHNVKPAAERGYEIGSRLAVPGAGITGGAIGAGAGALQGAAQLFLATPIGEFLTRALTNPGALQERQRPESGPSSLGPTPDQSAQFAPAIAAAVSGTTEAVKTGNDTTNSLLGNILNALINFLNGSAKQQPITEPSGQLGIRGAKGGFFHRLWNGGSIRGAGTSTSDSIPAMLSDGEYVLNAEATKRAGVANLDMINAGHALGGLIIRHFAEGGSVKGNLSVTYDPNTGGAYINGNLFLPGSPILDDPDIAAAIARSKADMNDKSSRKPKHFSASTDFGDFSREFGGGHAKGGLIGRDPGSFAQRLGAMGFAGDGLIDVPHLAIGGGVPDLAPTLSELAAPAAGGMDLAHFGTVNLATNHGTFPVITHEDTLRHMNTAAVEARTFSTGKKPGWHGGRG